MPSTDLSFPSFAYIDSAIRGYKIDSKDIYSVAILDQSEIPKLLEKIPEKMNIELAEMQTKLEPVLQIIQDNNDKTSK